MNLFCPQCFAKVEYKFSKPKFCPECGKQIAAAHSVIKNDNNADKIKKLETEIKDLKNGSAASAKFSQSSKLNVDYDSSDNIDEDENEDYFETQRHIDNFKNKKSKNGVVIEKTSAHKGISFGQLMEGVSSGNISVGDEFKMTSDSVGKTEQQILEEFRREATSRPKTIEVE